MSAINICTLVLEFNYNADPSAHKGSVWLYNGDGTHDLSQDEPLGEMTNWNKIVGPISLDEAEAIHARLKKFFEDSGVHVIDEGIAD